MTPAVHRRRYRSWKWVRWRKVIVRDVINRLWGGRQQMLDRLERAERQIAELQAIAGVDPEPLPMEVDEEAS